jgi:hypothetical protein
MYLLRCTASLRAAALQHHPPAEPADQSDTRLGDWYATRLNVGPQRYILASSGLSLLSVVVEARNVPALPDRLSNAVAAVLRDIGVGQAAAAAEIRLMTAPRVAPTADRRVLGSMTALRAEADWELRDLAFRPGRTLHYVNVRLATTPCGLLDYAAPAEVALRLLS